MEEEPTVTVNVHTEREVVPALNTLRHSAQVCSTWRNLILDSPSLWGRVIDLDCLHQDDWRREVLHRTGSSDLFIRYKGLCKLPSTTVISILAENWERVRSLDLDFHKNDPKATDASAFYNNSGLWNILKRPSNILESFRLFLQAREPQLSTQHSKTILSPPGFVIFNNHAPSLIKIFAPNINLNLHASWVSHIRHLSLNMPTPVDKLLEALTHMPLLDTLDDGESYQVIVPGGAKRTDKVALPQLKHIILSSDSNISPYLAFLSQIEPLDRRFLSFSHVGQHPSYPQPDTQDMAAASAILADYSRQAPLSVSTKVALFFLRERFRFCATLPSGRSFTFNLRHYSDPITELWSALDLPDFPNVHTANLILQTEFGVHPSDPKFGKFITSLLSKINTLHTTPESIGFLLRVPEDLLKAAFPVLREIVFSNWGRADDVSEPHRFLVIRKAMGRPIPTISVRKPGMGRLWMRSLEEITGLKVVVFAEGHRKEYICGSGSPEALDWGYGHCYEGW
ncbi:hypothetical protein GALMADRAFT_143145 [Galerina marginata CBS 339.88]|uniref:F-box domain-containing protein n=1 Tax=Galerina marginata (strain CBS 339.88) TaxID=685588 RepID=A0A067SZU2_GALM3|nr:hypothetical protein GALMADRAFT_143145 [Galerina marginata CBS 339.88]